MPCKTDRHDAQLSILRSLLAICLLALAVNGYGAHTNTASTPISSARLVVAPGSSGDLVIPVHNATAGQATFVLEGYYWGPLPQSLEYRFTDASDPRCGIPDLRLENTTWGRSRIVVGPLAANESLDCRWRVTRSAASRNDIMFGICHDAPAWFLCADHAFVGTLPDLTLTSMPYGPANIGDTTVLVRIVARNQSPVATSARRFHTECTEFAPPAGFFPAPFDVENDFQGACSTAPMELGCANFTGQAFERREFFTSALEPGQESSCLLKLKLRAPLSAPVGLDLYYEDVRVDLANGGIGYDMDESNGITRLTAAPFGGSNAVGLPVGGYVSAILGLLLTIAAALRVRRSTLAR